MTSQIRSACCLTLFVVFLCPWTNGCDFVSQKRQMMMTDDELRALESQYNDAKTHAISSVDVIAEFHQLYPEAYGFFSRFATDAPIWTSQVFLYDRYDLLLRVPIELSSDRRTVIAAGEPTFVLGELDTIARLPDGRFNLATARSWGFGSDKWEQLRDVNGRIEEVFTEARPDPPGATIPFDREPFDGIRVDDPVPGFRDYWDHLQFIRGSDPARKR